MSFSVRPPTCIDLFAGCGGLSEGLLAAGVDVVASVELHPQPALTHAFNHADTTVFVGDIQGWDPAILGDVDRAQHGIDIVVGGPPCQGFSSAGKKHVLDPRNSLFEAFARVVERTQPRMFLLENVPGFRTMFGGTAYKSATQAFRQLGYQIVDDVIRAADHGVPQRRRRFVMVGWLTGEVQPFQFPQPGGAPDDEAVQPADLTCYEALCDLDFLEPGFEATRYAETSSATSFSTQRCNRGELLFNHLASRHRARAVEIMQGIPEGGTIRGVDPTVRSAKRTMARLDRSRLANTVLSLPDDMIHYKHDRILTVRENARLQTFDDDFVFFGKRTSGFVERRVDVPQYTQVGNAVPPLLAQALGRALLPCLGGQKHDLRNLAARHARHELVRGSSGYAGYTLDPAAREVLSLRTVRGEAIDLPLDDADKLVTEQEPLRDWTHGPRPRRGQWAPGVTPKERPAWHGETLLSTAEIARPTTPAGDCPVR